MKTYIVLLFGILFITPSTVSAETITSDNFVLQDSVGRTTAQLTTSGDGTPAFFIYDNNGVVRVSIGLYPDGAPGVVLNDDKGLAGAIIRLVSNNGEPVVVLKENGQDTYVIRKGGPDTNPASIPILPIIIAIMFSTTFSAIFTLLMVKKFTPQTNQPPVVL